MSDIRLNIGGRDTTIPGFLVLDKYQSENVDIVGDASDLSMFKDGDVSTIYASHILEHFSHKQTVPVLAEWARVLKQGGKAYISVPDFNVIVGWYQKIGLTQWIIDLGWGGQEYAEAYHTSPFTLARLQDVCYRAGFADVKRINKMPFNLRDCSTLCDTETNQPISVNVEATK